MNREDIIRLAREAGIRFIWDKRLERFAALAAEWGAKQEREACAALVDANAAAIRKRKRKKVKP